ncbi:MAG: DUF389 domain-containing protein [Bacteroidales bacterium]|nr:DUF389 domain-containing protein [Bacteroidales bacterium]
MDIKSIWNRFRRVVRYYAYIFDEIDTASATQRIKASIWFHGPNAWILAFAIVLASVGLNVNSTAVIIGAMLVSPLMGPIIGTGLALGTNDLDLLKSASKNLLVMVIISLLASTLFFLLSPLSLVNPTELMARTSPTIYDVLIAFFGGMAGILENSRKERGTVLSGVAIATALMPPLCTAGYGLAHFNMHFFIGALYLFVINSVFIALATYLMVRYLKFPTVSGITEGTATRRRRAISTVLVIILVPSIWSAFTLIRNNNFERNVQNFVENNRLVAPRTYIYDYRVDGRKAEIALAGEPLDNDLRASIYVKAGRYNIKQKDLTLLEHSFGLSQQDMNTIIEEIYTNTNIELDENQALLESMESRLEDMAREINRLKERQDLLTTQMQQAQADTTMNKQ